MAQVLNKENLLDRSSSEIPCFSEANRAVWDDRRPTKNQHYVWRYYLWDWSCDGGVHIWRRKRGTPAERGKLKHTASFEMGYAIPNLSIDEMREVNARSQIICPDVVLRRTSFSSYLYSMLIRKLNESMSDADACCEYALEEKMLTDEARMRLAFRMKMDAHELPSGYLYEETRIAVEGLESFMTIVEDDVKLIIWALRRGGRDILRDEVYSARFANYVFKQYYRTRKYFKVPKERASEDRIAFFLRMLEADWIGRWYGNRGGLTYCFLPNQTSIPYLTSDQPVMNMCGDSTSWDMFFPVSRTLAVMLLPKGRFECAYRRFSHVGEDEVAALNQILADAATDEIYGISEAGLNDVAFN